MYGESVLRRSGSDLIAHVTVLTGSGNGVTGLTVEGTFYRESDTDWWNTSSSDFDLAAEPGTGATLTEIQDGLYEYVLSGAASTGQEGYRSHIVVTGTKNMDFAVSEVIEGHEVDVVSISGDSGAADNLESDYDGTGYDKANSKIGEVTSLGAQAKLDVNAEADTAISDYDPPTKTEMDTMETNLTAEIDANEAKLDIIDTVVDGIQTDLDNATDGLGAIKTAVDDNQTDLTTIEGKIDTVDTVVDGIQADLDNATDGLGAIKTAVDDNQTDLTTIEGKIDTVDTVVDGIQTDLDNATDGLGAIKDAVDANQADLTTIESKIDTIDTNVDSILDDTGTAGVVLADDAITAAKYDETTAYPVKSDDSGSTQIARVGADGDTLETLSDQIDGVQTSVDGIQNNTRFVATIPATMLIPDSGDTMYKITAHFYDTDGNMEDPDNNEIDILYEDVSGGDKDAFYDDAAGTTPATAGVIDANMWKMVKISTGVYETYYKLPNTESVEQWTASIKLEETSALLQYARSTNIVEENPGSATLADNTANKDIIAEALKERDVSGTGAVSGSIYKDINDNIDTNETKIDTIDTVVDGIQTDLDNATDGLGAIKDAVDAVDGKVDTVDTVVDGIQTDLDNATDGLGAIKTAVDDNQTDLTTIEGKIDIIDTVVDGIQTDLDNATDGLGAIKDAVDANQADLTTIDGKIDTIDTVVDSILDDTETSGVVLANNAITSAKIATDAIDSDALATSAVQKISDSMYGGGYIYLDTINGNSGNTDYVHGTQSNPVDSLADAITLAASLDIYRIKVAVGSSIVLSVTLTNYTLEGERWTLDLNGKNIGGSIIVGADVSGAYTGANAEFTHCILGAMSGPAAHFDKCMLTSDFTITAAGTFGFEGCHSMVAGVATPSIDFGAAVGNSDVNFRHYSGGIEINNIGQARTDNMSLEGHGQYILNANCTGGILAVRGHFKKTDNSGSVTISDIANYKSVETKIDIIDTVVDGIQTDLDNATDGLGAIKTAVDANQTDLTNIETKIDTIDTVVDGIQTDLDNATDGLGAIKTAVDDNQTDLTSIEGKVDVIDTVVDGIQTDLDNATDGLGAIKTAVDDNQTDLTTIEGKIDTIDTIVDSILDDTGTAGVKLADDAITASKYDETTAYPVKSDDSGSTQIARVGADGDTLETLSDQIDGVQTSVDGIQNNTRFVATIPTNMLVPDSGDTMYKLTVNFYDNDGNMEDPDANEIDVLYEDVAGGDKDAFYDDAGGTTPATAGVIDANMWKMVKIGTGIYETYYKLPNTETPEQWTATFKLNETSTLLQYSRSTNVVEENPGSTTLADNTTNKDIIAEALKERDVSGTGAVSGSIYKDINDNIDANETKIDTIDTVVDGIQTDLDNATDGLGAIKTAVDDNQTDLTTIEGKVDTVDTVVDAVKLKTDKLNFNSDGTPLVLADIRDVNDVAVTNIDDFKADASDVAGADVNVTTIEGSDATTELVAAVDASIETYGLDHLVAVAVTGTDVADNSIIAKLVSKETTADWDDFDNATNSLEAIAEAISTVDGKVDTVDTVVDGIQTDLDNATDGLGAIKTAVDANQTDLTSIESKVDTVDTVVNGIQTDLDNATDGLGAIKTAVDDNQTDLTSIESKVDTVDTVVDGIQTDLDNATDGLGAIKTAVDANQADLASIESKVDIVDANVDSVLDDTSTSGVVLADDAITSAKFDESSAYPVKSADTGSTQIARTGADADTLESISDQIDGVQTSVDGIQNNTRFVATVPNNMLIPDTGTTMYKITAHFYNTDGDMEDPDSNEIDILYEDVSGGDKDAFYDDSAGSTPATAGVIDTNMWQMNRLGIGIYETYYKLPSTESVEQWTASFKLNEASALLQYSRSVNVVEENPGSTTLADNATNKDIIAESLKERDVSGTSAVSGSIYKDINDNIDANETKIDTIDTVVDGIQIDLDNGTDGLGAIKTAVDSNQTDLTSIEGKVDTVDTVVDGIQTDLDNGIDGLGAIKIAVDDNQIDLTSIEDKVDTVDSGVSDVKAITDQITFGSGVNCNLISVNGNTVPIDNFEDDYDGTGYDKSNSKIGEASSLGTQAKVDVNVEVDSALDTAIPGIPVAGSINDVLKDVDAKLPLNNFMGSNVKTNKDDEIDDIKAKTDKLNFNSDGTPLVLADIRDVNNAAVTSIDDFKAGPSDITGADVNVTTIEGADASTELVAACDASIETYGLDHLIAVPVLGADIVDNSIIAKLASKSATADWDTFVNTTDSLQALADGTALTAQQIRDAMKLAPTGGFPQAGSVDEHLDNLLTNLAIVDSEVGVIDTIVDGIQSDISSGVYGLGVIKTAVDANQVDLTAIEGKIDTIDDVVHDIENNVGTPIALDSGVATVSGMLTKIADDNSGADYDASTDSLHEIGMAAGGTDWSTDERKQIRSALGVDGAKVTAGGGQLQDVKDTAETIDTHVDDVLAVIGTAIALDDGDPTLAGMLVKMADDANGTAFDAGEDSLHEIGLASGGTDWTSDEKKQIRDVLGVDGVKTTAASGQVQGIASDITVIKDDVENGVYGLSAIKVKIDEIDTAVGLIKAVSDLIPDAGAMTSIAQEATLGIPISSIATDIATALTAITGVRAEIDDATYGLAALKTAIGDIDLDLLEGIIDGSATVKIALKKILAYCAGDINRIGNVYTYRNYDDAADEMVHTATSTTRVRT